MTKAIKQSSGYIPVILMNDIDGSGRKRSFYPNNKIYALQQGADNKDKDKAIFLGDSHVVVDTNQINIQIHKIIPKKKDSSSHIVQYSAEYRKFSVLYRNAFSPVVPGSPSSLPQDR